MYSKKEINYLINLLLLGVISRLDVSGQGVLGLFGLGSQHGGASVTFGRLLVDLHQASEIELGLLQDLDLSDADILQGKDGAAVVGDQTGDGLRDELLDEILEGDLGAFGLHDLDHLFADLLDVGGLGIAGGLDLVGLTGGEGQAEQTDGVAVRGLDVSVALDGGLPLLDQGALLVAGQLHTVEVGQAVAALNVLDAQRDLARSLIVIVVQVSKIDLHDAALETFGGDLGTLSTGNQCLTAVADGKIRRGLAFVPLLAGEGVDELLLLALFAFCEALVLSNSHIFLYFFL